MDAVRRNAGGRQAVSPSDHSILCFIDETLFLRITIFLEEGSLKNLKCTPNVVECLKLMD